jgi:hypothetical protein
MAAVAQRDPAYPDGNPAYPDWVRGAGSATLGCHKARTRQNPPW